MLVMSVALWPCVWFVGCSLVCAILRFGDLTLCGCFAVRETCVLDGLVCIWLVIFGLSG